MFQPHSKPTVPNITIDFTVNTFHDLNKNWQAYDKNVTSFLKIGLIEALLQCIATVGLTVYI